MLLYGGENEHTLTALPKLRTEDSPPSAGTSSSSHSIIQIRFMMSLSKRLRLIARVTQTPRPQC